MDAILTNVVEQAVLERMKAKESFTALDISNALKADRYPFRHREVAEVVRDVYHSGAMAYFDYERELIPVVTEGGTKATQAFLYHHTGVRPREYIARDQDALPPVSADQARDLSDCVAAGSLAILPRRAQPARRCARTAARRSPCIRQDGALSIPRRFVEQLGWAVGTILSLRGEAGCLTIGPDSSDTDCAVRVWGGQRVRVCKTKLRLGALSADSVTLEIDGDSLQIAAQD